MAFGNNNQGEKKKYDVNTKGVQFYNINAGTLIVGYWKDCMTVKICPVLPQSKRSESKVYDYDTFINTAFTLEKLTTMQLAIDSHIMASMQTGNPYDFTAIGVSVGSNFVELSNGEKHGLAKENICFTIYAGVDENGKSSDKMTFVFGKRNYFTNFDSEVGSIDKGADLEIEFLMFYRCIKEAAKAMTHAYAHSIRHSDQYTVNGIRESLNSIKTKLGIESSTYSKPSGNASFFNAGSGNKFGNNNSSSNEDVGRIENGGTISSGGRLDI